MAWPDPLLGTLMDGRYLLERPLANGLISTVYRARHTHLTRPAAVKILNLSTMDDGYEEFYGRFLKEASILSRLTHPNTVRIYDYGIWEHRPYLVMELLDGRPLSQMMEGPCHPLLALHITRQVVLALQEAHQLGLVHRDIKPANVFASGPLHALRIKLIDFGLAKDLRDQTSRTITGQIVGSPAYMSPEQIQGEAVDSRADIYSIGCLLFQLLTGKVPFPGEVTSRVLLAHINTTPPRFATVQPDISLPQCVEWTVRSCLEKDPAARFSSAHELLRALRFCQLALQDASHRNDTLTLRNGVLQVPPALSLSSISDSGSGSFSVVVPPLPAPPPPARARLLPMVAIGSSLGVVAVILLLAALGALSPAPVAPASDLVVATPPDPAPATATPTPAAAAPTPSEPTPASTAAPAPSAPAPAPTAAAAPTPSASVATRPPPAPSEPPPTRAASRPDPAPAPPEPAVTPEPPPPTETQPAIGGSDLKNPWK